MIIRYPSRDVELCVSISFGIKKRDPGKSQAIKDVSELMLLKVVETRGDLEGYLEGSQMSESLGTKCSCGD